MNIEKLEKDINKDIVKNYNRGSTANYELGTINLNLQDDVMNLTINDKRLKNSIVKTSR